MILPITIWLLFIFPSTEWLHYISTPYFYGLKLVLVFLIATVYILPSFTRAYAVGFNELALLSHFHIEFATIYTFIRKVFPECPLAWQMPVSTFLAPADCNDCCFRSIPKFASILSHYYLNFH